MSQFKRPFKQPYHLKISALVLSAWLAGPASATNITPVFDSSGTLLMNTLLAGSGLTFTDHLNYVGATDAGNAQAGLFSNLVIQGDLGTQQILSGGIMLTSGFVTNLPTSNTAGYYGSDTGTGGSNIIDKIGVDLAKSLDPSASGKGYNSGNSNELTFRFEAPTGASGVFARFVYASDEFPEWAGSQFADGFAFVINGVNYATLPDGTPVSLISQESNIHFMPNGENALEGAVSIVDLEYDGFTRVLEIRAPIVAGENEITVVVADTGDEVYDSAVFLSGLSLLTEPVPGTDYGIKLSDDDFVEYEIHHSSPAPVPEPETWGLMLAGLALVARVARNNVTSGIIRGCPKSPFA
jgi:hypothetical protein